MRIFRENTNDPGALTNIPTIETAEQNLFSTASLISIREAALIGTEIVLGKGVVAERGTKALYRASHTSLSPLD